MSDRFSVSLHWVECPMFMVESRVIKFVAWITRGSAQQATLFFHPKKEPRRPRLRAQRKDLRLARVIFHGFVIRGVRFIFFIPTSELCKAFFTAGEKAWAFVKKCVELSSKRICELSQLLSDSEGSDAIHVSISMGLLIEQICFIWYGRELQDKEWWLYIM